MNNLISIVIPTFNRVKLLQRAIESVMRQSYEKFEIIVVIDGKDILTEFYLANLALKNLRIIINEKNMGGAESRNIGVQEAIGEWIAFLDDDDEWLPEKLEKQMNVIRSLNKSTSHDIIGCQIIARKLGVDQILATKIPVPDRPIWEYILERNSLYLNASQVQTSTLMIKKSTLLEFPFLKVKRHQEWDLLLRISILSPSRYFLISEPLAVWHIDENRSRISTHISKDDYLFSIDWINKYAKSISKRAYGDFMLTVVSDIARHSNNRPAQFKIFTTAIRFGKPGIYSVVIWFSIFLFPRSFRHILKSLLSSKN